jgi:succinyl-CoA synthetase beta subunit
VCGSHLATHLEEHLAELDINPLMVLPRGQGVKAVDALVVFAAHSTARSAATIVRSKGRTKSFPTEQRDAVFDLSFTRVSRPMINLLTRRHITAVSPYFRRLPQEKPPQKNAHM